ncbi:MAG: 3-oxoacyl-[acyl-carrier protein] reductase [Saprospiraceae bacterium]|jgi:3-oxoacyl-[acyl-carrier protein] reductase
MELGLTGRKAFVMASSKGLGRGVALELAIEGVHVALCGRNEETLKEAQQVIQEASGGKGKVMYSVGDVTSRVDRSRIWEEVSDALGSIDILVTNSGGPPAGAFETHSLDTWQETYQLLLESTVDMIQRASPNMKANRWGRIITISSQAIKQPVPGLILSNAVRSSLLGLVKTLSQEFGPHGVTVNNVLPGYTKTQRLHSLIEANPKVQDAVNDIPLRRFAEVEEFAAAVTFLCSERASYISGVSLPVDGGWIKGI